VVLIFTSFIPVSVSVSVFFGELNLKSKLFLSVIMFVVAGLENCSLDCLTDN